LLYFQRKDTIETWFEDGVIKSQKIKYAIGDTIFEKSFSLHYNRELKEKYLQRQYTMIITSEIDSTDNISWLSWDYLYKEVYFSNGQPKYIQRKDTSYTWFENGKINIKCYDSGFMKYNEQGHLEEKYFHWVESEKKELGKLNQTLYFEYSDNGNLGTIHFVRDEPSEDGKSLAPNVRYYWKWDEKHKLIEAPEKWNEAYPWEKINEIKLLLIEYELH